MGHRVLRREEEPNVQIDGLRKRIEVLERRIIPGPPALASLRRNTHQTINPGTGLIEWTQFKTTDRDIFATTTGALYPVENNSPDDTLLLIKQEGLVAAILETQWEAGLYERACVIASTTSEPALGPADFADGDPFDSTWSMYLGTNYPFGTVPEQMNFTVSHTDAVDHDITNAAVIVLFWPADAETIAVYG